MTKTKNTVGSSVAKVETQAEKKTTLTGLVPGFDTKKTEVPAITSSGTGGTTSLQNIIAAQLTDRKFAPVQASDLTKKVTYVTASNGLFKVVKTDIALFKVKLSEMSGEIPGLPPMSEGVELLIPKIPFRKLIEALSFYKDVNTKDKAEASILFFWNERNVPLLDIPGLSSEGKLVTYCPVQVNSAALSDFTKDEHVEWLRNNLSLLLETHSHRVNSIKCSA